MTSGVIDMDRRNNHFTTARDQLDRRHSGDFDAHGDDWFVLAAAVIWCAATLVVIYLAI